MKLYKTEAEGAASTAKDEVNNQVRGFACAKIMPVTDLHKCLWLNSQRVVKALKIT